MLNELIAAISATLVIASLAPGSALAAHRTTAAKAGAVGAGGQVAGSGYSISHDGTGAYTIEVPAGFFHNCPAVMVTPAGGNGDVPIANDYNYISCGNHGDVKIQIRIVGRSTGNLQDNAFHFVMVDAY
ncbi:MAG TPA: hypothetical protein VHR97_08055 [Candidatus Baltobacteraceae bacterium]|nr:hypothetical protein [Candidatus Baltobacteraceae bacterium]